MKKIFTLITLLSFSFVSYSQVSPNVKIFTNYHYDATDDNSDSRSFELKRAYFGAKTKLSDDISAEVTFDVGNNTGGTAYTAFLKKAYMKWQVNDDFKLSMGMQSTTQFNLLEKNWGFRYIMKSAQDQYKFGSAADLGLVAVYSLGSNISIDASFMNGEGYKNVQDADGYMKSSVGVTFSPVDNLTLRGYSDREGATGPNSSTMSIGMHYKTGCLGFGYEKSDKDNYNNVAGDNRSVSSFYGSCSMENDFTLLARRDNLEGDINTNSQMTLIGVQKTLTKGLKAALNYQHVDSDDDSDDSEFVYLNLEIKF